MMLKRLVGLLSVVALLVASFGMLSGHAAMAMPAPEATSGHCADMAGSHHEVPDETAPAADIDCMIACACVPAAGPELSEAPAPVKDTAAGWLAIGGAGSNPAADPPPPRLS